MSEGAAGGGIPFWKAKPLDRLSGEEWDALCDGCGKCCLVKMEDEDTGAVLSTDVACRLLDCDSCRCRDYPNRKAIVPDCVVLTPDNLGALDWMPATCAYRLGAGGRDLPWWHPLVSGDPGSVRRAGVGAHGRVVSEETVDEDRLFDRVASWPD